MYDPSKFKELITEDRCAGPKYTPYTLEHLAEWLATFPPEREYDFWNCEGGCLFGQYMAAHGCNNFGDEYIDALVRFGDSDWARTQSIAAVRPRTFGAALTRAQAALERSSPKPSVSP